MMMQARVGSSRNVMASIVPGNRRNVNQLASIEARSQLDLVVRPARTCAQTCAHSVDERWTNQKLLGIVPCFGGQPCGFEKYLLTRENGTCKVGDAPASARKPEPEERPRASGAPFGEWPRARVQPGSRGGSGVGGESFATWRSRNRETGERSSWAPREAHRATGAPKSAGWGGRPGQPGRTNWPRWCSRTGQPGLEVPAKRIARQSASSDGR